MRKTTLLLLVLLVLFLATTRLPADQAASSIYKKTVHATVWVITPKGFGTGWVVDRGRRLIITNTHVVAGQSQVQVVFPAFRDGGVIPERSYYKNAPRVRGRVLTTDPRRDLAAIAVDRLPEGTTELKLAAEDVGPGDRVHSVGNPGASEALWVYTSGTVRQVYRRHMKYGTGQEVEARVIETQSPINPGDSGGPVVNDNGDLVGVNASHLTGAQLVSYCIDLSEVRPFVARVRTFVASPEAKEAQPHQERARALMRKGMYAQAVAEYTEAIRANPQDALAYRERGLAYRRMQDYDKAIADYTEAIRLDPKDVVAYNNRAAAHYVKGEYDQAIADATEALRLEPKYPLAFKNRGIAYAAKGDSKKAVEDYSEAIRINPRDAVAYKARAAAYAKLGQDDLARADRDKAAELERAASGARDIKDEAKFFSPEAVQKANEEIRAIATKYKRQLVIETIPALPDDESAKVKAMTAAEREKFFHEWTLKRAEKDKINGVYLLVCRNPTHLQVVVTPQARTVFNTEARDRLARLLLGKFREKKFDEALAEAVRFVREHLAESEGKSK
jgi:tetratricopeptide (TPR) repeat protein